MRDRIFIGYSNIVSVGTLLKNGFNSLNIKADFYTSEKNRSVYDYYGNESFITLYLSESLLIRYFQISFFLLKILVKYKYFIFIQKGTLLKNNKDVRLLKLFGKKTIIIFAGCDIRMPKEVEKFKWNPCSNCTDDYKIMVSCNIERKKNDLKKIENVFDIIFSPDECAGFIKKKYYSINFPVDFNYLDKQLILEGAKQKSSIIIVHAPSNYHVKGTRFIENAVANLKLKHPSIIYKRLQGMPKSEIIKELMNADIVIDQMLVGYYGVLAVEAMALEKPVVCYIRPDLWENLKNYCPIVNANPDNLEAIVESLIINKKNLNKIGIKSREYAKEYHSPNKVAEKMLKIFMEHK